MRRTIQGSIYCQLPYLSIAFHLQKSVFIALSKKIITTLHITLSVWLRQIHTHGWSYFMVLSTYIWMRSLIWLDLATKTSTKIGGTQRPLESIGANGISLFIIGWQDISIIHLFEESMEEHCQCLLFSSSVLSCMNTLWLAELKLLPWLDLIAWLSRFRLL